MTINAATNIVFVGAGPIGLSTAIQTKLRNKNLNIVLVDKYAKYARTQKLRLSAGSFSGIPDSEELRPIIEDFLSKKLVPIQEIESKLKELAKKIGIQFIQHHVTEDNIGDLRNKFPNAKYIIGADGSRSIVRQTIFKDDFSKNESLEYIAQVSYKATSEKKKLHPHQKKMTSKFVETYVEETVSKENDVCLRFFIDQQTYERIQDAKAKNPWKINDTRIPEKFRSNIEAWMKARKCSIGESLVDSSEPILTAIELKMYSAKKTVAEKDGVTYCLVGDAAGGVPYFRSINKGFKESTQLAKAIAYITDPKESQEKISKLWEFRSKWDKEACEGAVEPQLRAYASYAKSNAKWENLVARMKTILLDCLIAIIKFAKKITPKTWMEKIQQNSLERDRYYRFGKNAVPI